jgi:hypothetical protein
MTLVWPFWVAGGGLLTWALWQAVNFPQRISWTQDTTIWDTLAQHADQWIRSRWAEHTRIQARILRITFAVILQYMVYSAAAAGAVLWIFVPHLWLVILLGMAGAGYWGPSWIIQRRFKQYQGFLRRDFAPLVLILRIYFDLMMPVDQALLAASRALGKTSQREINRLLTAIHTGAGGSQALTEWGKRPQLMEYRLLADTITQNWQASLTGEALAPLDTLIESNREQGTRSLADRLDAVATIVPILAAFGILVLVIFTLLYGSFGGGMSF